jgi:hypothetical protein
MMNKSLLTIAMTALGGCLAACSQHATEPTVASLAPALQAYLAARGDLCLGKSSWPIDLTQHEIDTGARNALQMPVLERLGMVTSTVAHVVIDDEGAQHPVDVRRYALTEAGGKFYRTRNGAKAGDFCAARLSLDHIVSWTAMQPGGSQRQVLVNYTYAVKAAPWTADAQALKVFPLVAGVIQGAGKRQLQEAFVQDAKGQWIAVDLQPRS